MTSLLSRLGSVGPQQGASVVGRPPVDSIQPLPQRPSLEQRYQQDAFESGPRGGRGGRGGGGLDLSGHGFGGGAQAQAQNQPKKDPAQAKNDPTQAKQDPAQAKKDPQKP